MHSNSHDYEPTVPAPRASDQSQVGTESKDVSSYFKFAPVALICFDHEGRIFRINKSAQKLLLIGSTETNSLSMATFVEPADLSVFDAFCMKCEDAEQGDGCELRMRKFDGTRFWASLSGVRLEETAAESGFLITVRDVSNRMEFENTLKRHDERFKYAIEATRDGIWDWDIESGHVFFSPQWARLLGYEPDEVPQNVNFFFTVLHPDDVERINNVLQAHLSGRIPIKQDEVRLRTKSGEYRWFLDRGEVVERDVTGRPLRMVGTITDITQRRFSEDRLRENQARTRLLIEAAKLGLWDWDLITNEVYFSPEWKAQLGYADDELPNEFSEWKNRLHPDDLPCVLATLDDFFESRVPKYDIEFRLRHADGTWRWIFARADVLRDSKGSPVRMMGCHLDITDRKQAESAREDALNRLQKIASRLPGSVYQYRLRADGRASIPYASDGLKDLFQVSAAEIPDVSGLMKRIVDLDAFQESVRTSARELKPWVHEFQIRYDDGSLRWLAGNSVPELETEGATIWHGFITDVTERKLAEAKRRVDEQRLREAQAISQVGNFHWDAQTDRVTWSDQLYRIYDRDPETFEPTFESYVSLIHVEDRQRVLQQLRTSIEHRLAFDHQYRLALPNNSLRWIRARGNTLVDGHDQLLGIEGTCQDISEQKRIEATTASLEAQLRESQKMEAIGALAGGIAHDFNNILAAILGNVEIASLEHEHDSSTVKECLDNIRRAGDRARDLIQQILSFSRRQQTNRQPISLAPVINEAARLLSATLPARLKLEVQCAVDAPKVLADATQISQVVLNLVTNAMQAMNGQPGLISIRLDSIDISELSDDFAIDPNRLRSHFSGGVVRLTVSDDGPGMCPETKNRIFDPFFTTKSVDRGTGLGLAVVHGIIQSHGGIVLVDSEIGCGSTFTVYLPATADLEVEKVVEPLTQTTEAEVNPTTSLHVLFLDDDKAVLSVAKQLLEHRGYRISCFSCHQDALEAFVGDSADFDLVITDYNMPGMQGLEVAREIRKIRDDVPVVITSGYIDAELTAGASACGVKELLAKPFRLADLYAVVQRLATEFKSSS